MNNPYEWIERHLAALNSAGRAEETTIPDRKRCLTRLNEDLPLGLLEATIEELEHWLARPGWSKQTKATYYGHIVGFFRWAADPQRSPHLSYDPSVSLTRPTVRRTLPRPVTDEQLAQALDRARGRYQVYILLAAYAGMRAASIAKLEREDITEQVIVVKGKGGKETAIPTHPVIWAAVRDLPPGPIATLLDGRQATAKHVSAYTSRHLARRGLRNCGLHRYRHWCATTALRNGANLRTVQELLMHASPTTTAIYTEVTSEERRLAICTLPALVPALI